jgi:protein phosphatase PTC2/3
MFRLSAGSYSHIGWRPKLEDEEVIVEDINRQYRMDLDFRPHSWFGVFDGHMGSDAAQFASEHLLKNLLAQEDFVRDPVKALEQAFVVTDEQFRKVCEKEGIESGSTAITALIRGAHLFVTNLGDSRAVLSSLGKARPMSIDHKPNMYVHLYSWMGG